MWIQYVLREVTNEVYIHQKMYGYTRSIDGYPPWGYSLLTDTKAGAMDTQCRAPWPHGK